MTDLRERLAQTRDRLSPTSGGFDRFQARVSARRRRHRAGAGLAALVVTAAAFSVLARAFSGIVPSDPATAAPGRSLAVVVFKDPRAEARPSTSPLHRVVSIGTDGSSVEPLTAGDADYLEPAWSPDGTRLAVVRFERTADELDEAIYVIDVETGEQERLLTTGEPRPISVLDIEWSPDGTQIGFIYARHGEGGEWDPPTAQILVMPATGGEPVPVTAADEHVASFSWSPTGDEIVYTGQELEPDGVRIRSNLYVIGIGGSNRRQLTSGGFDTDPAWSPAGDEIAFVRHAEGNEASGDIYAVSSNGVAVWRLTDTPEWEESPTWSPDASRIAFARGGESFTSCRLVIADADGTAETEIADHNDLGGCPQGPAWTPDPSVTASPGPDSIVWEETYRLADFQVEHPHTHTDPSGQAVIDRSEANVLFTSRWTGSVYPGEAKCVIVLLDAAGEPIGRGEFGLV
ncbi:MAG: hypothetical protein ACRDQ2_17505, partial [Gaiellales bacterium]